MTWVAIGRVVHNNISETKILCVSAHRTPENEMAKRIAGLLNDDDLRRSEVDTARFRKVLNELPIAPDPAFPLRIIRTEGLNDDEQ